MTTTSEFCDQEGQPISQEEWHALLSTPNYRMVRLTCPQPELEVMTFWVGRLPYLFETLVRRLRRSVLASLRYATRQQALDGHTHLHELFALPATRYPREKEPRLVQSALRRRGP
jgi:hypothetical protein